MKIKLLKIFSLMIVMFMMFVNIANAYSLDDYVDNEKNLNEARDKLNKATPGSDDWKKAKEEAESYAEKEREIAKELDENGINYQTFFSFDDYKTIGNGGKDVGVSNAQTILGSLITIIRMVGTGVAIAMLMWLGIHYMLSAPEEKTQVKKSMVPYVVGAVVLFSGAELLKIIEDFAIKNIN